MAVTLKPNEMFYLNLFNISNNYIGNTLRTFLEMSDSNGRRDTAEVSAQNAEKIKAITSDCNLRILFDFDKEKKLSGCIITIRNDKQECSRIIETMKLRFESADISVRNLEIRYNVFESGESAQKATIGQFEKLFVDTLSFEKNESGYEIYPVTTVLQTDSSGGLSFTDEDIKAMILADLKVLKCFAKTEKVEDNIRLLEEMKNGNRPSDYGSLLAIEQQIAGLIEDALLDVRRYRASLLSYEKKGK